MQQLTVTILIAVKLYAVHGTVAVVWDGPYDPARLYDLWHSDCVVWRLKTLTATMMFCHRNSSLGKSYGRERHRVERGGDETMTASVTTSDASGTGHPDTAGARHTRLYLDKWCACSCWRTGRAAGAFSHVCCVDSRPSDHYFRSVCWFVCLSVCLCNVQSFSQPSLIRFRSH